MSSKLIHVEKRSDGKLRLFINATDRLLTYNALKGRGARKRVRVNIIQPFHPEDRKTVNKLKKLLKSYPVEYEFYPSGGMEGVRELREII